MNLNSLLLNIKAIKKNKPTNAGILFFGKNPLHFISHAQIRCARIKGNEIYSNILDRLDCNGTLWEMILQAEEFIKKNIRFMGLRTDQFQRIDKYEYPIKALREAMINAVIHRDYINPADVRIFIFDDRVEIINPGNFPDGVSPDNPRHKPVCQILSNYMYDIGFIEKYGSGIYLEKRLCQENGNDFPIYELDEIETKVIFKSQVKIVSVDGEAHIKSDLNERQKRAINFIAEKGKITNQKYKEINKLTSDKTAYRDLQDMADNGVIASHGTKKGRYYTLNGK